MDGGHALDGGEDSLKDEFAEWEKTNKLLKCHGCASVRVLRAQDWGSLPGAVLLDAGASLDVRNAIRSLVEDSERRQNLLHDLIKANNQLKEDARLQQSRADRSEQKAADLQKILENVKSKIRLLEDDFIAKTCKQQTQMKSLLKEKLKFQDQDRKHRERIQELEENISELRTRLSQAETAEEERAARQTKAFLRLVKRPQKENSVLDQQILDVVAEYERQVSRLQQKLRRCEVGGAPARDRESSEGSLDLDVSPNYGALLKSYQEQIRKGNRRQEELERENSRIREELASRPSGRELNRYKQQVRSLQKTLSLGGTVQEKTEQKPGEPLITAVQHLEQLPVSECQRYLQEVCSELRVGDLKDLRSVVSSKAREAEACVKLREVLTEIGSVLGSRRAPQLVYKHSIRLHEALHPNSTDESDFLHLLPTVELWAGQLLSLKALRRALRKLREKLLPHQQIEETWEGSESVRVEELLLLVDTMMEEVESRTREPPHVSPRTLQALVSHFQKLFDVSSLSGVCPRMNEVYSRLGEMNNMMKNLRCLLRMDSNATCAALVNAVCQLCRDVEDRESEKLQRILGMLDVDSVINKLQEHEEFFPAFEGLIKALLDLLEISRLEEILPAVRRLQELRRAAQ